MPIRPAQELVDAASTRIDTLSVGEAGGLVGKADVQFVDVREPAEWAQGHIPGAVHIPRGLLEFQADPSLPSFKGEIANKALVVYCGVGSRSALAAKTLVDMGYEDVASLAGGYTAWAQDQRPTER